MEKENQIFYACGYVRASREDRDKTESNTIVNQRSMIEEFVKKHPNIILKEIKKDDGESGVSFDRPGFQEMLALVKTGKINCVIVKDLSRLGRNWLESGQYIQQIFPFFNVRFIAINDYYDSFDSNTDIEQIMVPFKNLMNEAYARDTSVKTRSVFETKRKAGEFVGAFVPYGYKRSDEDKHQLVIDEYPANVIKDIFKMRIDGMSADEIAKRLNMRGVLSPMEYKASKGIKYATNFKSKPKAEWSAVAVCRILKNEIYTGCLVQGKRSSPNYKVKKVQLKDENEWIRIEDAHESIVDKEDFNIVQSLFNFDTRSSPKEKRNCLFSGVVFCGDCRQNMTRKTAYGKNKKYYYYVCSSHKADHNTCSAHHFSENKLEEIVLQAVQKQISELTELTKMLDQFSIIPAQKAKVNRIKLEIKNVAELIDKTEQRKKRTYDDYADGLLNKEDFRMLNETYTDEIQKYKIALSLQESELRTTMESAGDMQWIEIFTREGNIKKLDRRLVVTLIDKIYVYENNRIEIIFKYDDKYLEVLSFIQSEKYDRKVI